MKNIFLSTIAIAFFLTACNHKEKQAETNDSPKTERTSQLYACPMHPEVKGKKGDKCSECGMELTEPVTETLEK